MTDFINEVRKEVEASPIKEPLTLDDVTKRINTICEQFVEDAKRHQAIYEVAVSALAEAVKASPDLDKSAVGSIVFGRVARMLNEVNAVLGR